MVFVFTGNGLLFTIYCLLSLFPEFYFIYCCLLFLFMFTGNWLRVNIYCSLPTVYFLVLTV